MTGQTPPCASCGGGTPTRWSAEHDAWFCDDCWAREVDGQPEAPQAPDGEVEFDGTFTPDLPPPPPPWEVASGDSGPGDCCASGRCEVCAPGGFGGSRYW